MSTQLLFAEYEVLEAQYLTALEKAKTAKSSDSITAAEKQALRNISRDLYARVKAKYEEIVECENRKNEKSQLDSRTAFKHTATEDDVKNDATTSDDTVKGKTVKDDTAAPAAPDDAVKSNTTTPDDTVKGNTTTPDDTVKGNTATLDGTAKGDAAASDDAVKDNTTTQDDTAKGDAAAPDDAVKDNTTTLDDTAKGDAAAPNDAVKDNTTTLDDTAKGDTAAPNDAVKDNTATLDDTAKGDAAAPNDAAKGDTTKVANGDAVAVEVGKKPDGQFRTGILSWSFRGRNSFLGFLTGKMVGIIVEYQLHTKGDDEPRFSIRVRFPIEVNGVRTYGNATKITTRINFMPRQYHVTLQEVTDEALVRRVPEILRPQAQAAFDKKDLYSYDFKLGALLMTTYGEGIYIHSNPQYQEAWDSLASLSTIKDISLLCFKHEDIHPNLEYLLNAQENFVPVINSLKHIGKDPVRVVWGQHVENPPKKSIQARNIFHGGFDEYLLLQGNAIKYEAEREVHVLEKLRNTKVKMSLVAVIEPGENLEAANANRFLGFLQIPEVSEFRKILEKAGSFEIVFYSFPEAGKTKEELGLKPDDALPRDEVSGWPAFIRSETLTEKGADLTIWLERPMSSENSEKDRSMIATAERDQDLPSELVYIRLRPNTNTVRTQLNALDRHRSRPGQEEYPAMKLKKDWLCGLDFSVTRNVDFLAGLDDEEIEEQVSSMTERQQLFFTDYLRNVPNGLAMLQGPYGTGKTRVIAGLGQMLVMLNAKKTATLEQKRRLLVVTSQNSTADTVTEVLSNKHGLLVVRLHNMSLERNTMTRESRDGIAYESLLPPNAEPFVEGDDENEDRFVDGSETHKGIGKALPTGLQDEGSPSAGEDNGWESEGEQDEVFKQLDLKYDLYMLNAHEELAKDRDNFVRPADPRMQLNETALYHRLLQLGNIIHGPYALTAENTHANEKAIFCSLYKLQKTQQLNRAEKKELKEVMETLAALVIQICDVTITVTVQVGLGVLRDVRFFIRAVDEATTPNEPDVLCALPGTSNTVLVGDVKQLGPVVLTTADQNVLNKQIAIPLMARMIELSWPYHELIETMRMTQGLLDVPNSLFYEGRLVYGPDTELENRPDGQRFLDYTAVAFPKIALPPAGTVLPVLVNVAGSETEKSSDNSVSNERFVDYTVTLVQDMIAKGIDGLDIGVICPYAAQVDLYHKRFRKEGMSIKTGTPEKFQGSEVKYAVVDSVRGGDSKGALGFLTNARRLCVMLSRHRDGYIVIADTECVRDPGLDVVDTSAKNIEKQKKEKRINQAKKDRLDNKNKHIIALFDLFKKMDRIHNVDPIPVEAPIEYVVPESGFGHQEWEAGATNEWS